MMRIKYDSESDILYLVLRDHPPVDAIEEPGGVVVSYGEDGEAVSVEFMNASVRRLVDPNELNVTLHAA
jgi:uncharacterized protein YuzE